MEALRKARDKLRLSHHGDDVVGGGEDRLPGITDNAAFNRHVLSESAGEGDERSKTQKVKDQAKSVLHVTVHPHRAAKEKATAQIVGNERPWLDNQAKADEGLFAAHDALDEAAGRDTHDVVEEATARLKATVGQEEPCGQKSAEESRKRKRIRDIEDEREELQIAWHLSRYVTRVRAVRRPLAYPERDRYKNFTKDGKYAGLNWIKYLGHLALYAFQPAALHHIDPTNAVPYDRDILIRRLERLLIASEAFQLWWMRVRFVYSWSDPWLTLKWLLLFLLLLKTGYFMTVYWAYLLYSVVTNRFGKHSRTWMRRSHERSTETKQRANMLSELIIRHGSDAWLEPFLREFGPWIQLQIGDVADFLEICANYYDWRNPRSTWCTCFNYGCLILISAIPSLEWSIKVFWLSCGLFFFLSRPISSLYPRFRHAVDPVRWMYWDSPTMAEWGFGYLQKQASKAVGRKGEVGSMVMADEGTDDGILADDEDDGADEDDVFFDCPTSPHPARASAHTSAPEHDEPLLSFPARWSGRRGRLQLTPTHLRFISSRSPAHPSSKSAGAVQWQRLLSEILELRKTSPPPSTTTSLPYADALLGPGAKKQKIPSLPNSKKKAALSLIFASLDPRVSGLDTTEEVPVDVMLAEGRAEEELVYGMEEAVLEAAFNGIVGVSEVGWMALQQEPGEQTRVH